jgi:hypothetical protein
MGVPFGRMALTFASSAAKPLFEGLHGMFVLGMVARPCREFDVAQLLQLAADGGLVERDGKLVVEPPGQIDQPPTHHSVDCRDRAALDDIDQCLALRIVQPRTGAGRFAIQQSIGTAGIEPDHPVAHNLKTNSADPSRSTSATAVVNFSQRQQPPRLVRALRRPRQSSQRRPVKIFPQADR